MDLLQVSTEGAKLHHVMLHYSLVYLILDDNFQCMVNCMEFFFSLFFFFFKINIFFVIMYNNFTKSAERGKSQVRNCTGLLDFVLQILY